MFWPFGVLAFNFLVAGLALFVLGLRSRTGLALNQWWGLRTKKTMVDEETFAKANRAIWRIYVFQGCVSITAGIATLIVGIVNNEAYPLLAAIGLGSTLVFLTSMLYASTKAHRSIS
ncbi:SdpI family protein [Actinomyces qiguomingii]|uniref:SdpI family protein n=1 Tax=Actinomyces qiguomingii TaxID=2057800 RepID=UPI000CA02802|nr:SdpI family protein [Actinomyces qiguomingii]